MVTGSPSFDTVKVSSELDSAVPSPVRSTVYPSTVATLVASGEAGVNWPATSTVRVNVMVFGVSSVSGTKSA